MSYIRCIVTDKVKYDAEIIHYCHTLRRREKLLYLQKFSHLKSL